MGWTVITPPFRLKTCESLETTERTNSFAFQRLVKKKEKTKKGKDGEKREKGDVIKAKGGRKGR